MLKKFLTTQLHSHENFYYSAPIALWILCFAYAAAFARSEQGGVGADFDF